MRDYPALLATLSLAAALMTGGCGGMAVYKADSLDTSSRDAPLHGVPFYVKVPKIKVTKYLDKANTVLLETREPVLVVDHSRVFVVEGQRNWLNPFEQLEFGATVHSDGTLASGTYKRDPQLDEAMAAAASGATAAAGFVSDGLTTALLNTKGVEKIMVTYELPPATP